MGSHGLDRCYLNFISNVGKIEPVEVFPGQSCHIAAGYIHSVKDRNTEWEQLNVR